MKLPKLKRNQILYFIRTDGLTFARTLLVDTIQEVKHDETSAVVITKNYEAWLYDDEYQEFWDVDKERLLKKWADLGEHVYVPIEISDEDTEKR